MPPERTLYEILGVPRTATADEIKSAYRRAARKHHPDVNPGDKAAEERFKEVAAAFDVLGNTDKRKLYDELGADAQNIGFDPEKARAYRQWRSARERAGTGQGGFEGQDVPFDLGDIFGDVFGGKGRAPAPRGPAAGEDVEAMLAIDLADSVRGAERRIEIERPERCAACNGVGAKRLELCPRCHGSGVAESGRGPLRFRGVCPSCGGSGQVPVEPCRRCNGTGVVERRTQLDVKVPKGAVDGTVVRLAGQGAAGLRGGPPGDLLLTVRLRPHPLVRLDGHDLSFDLPVTIGEAIAGAEVKIPTFEGDVHLKLPAGSQSGRRLRLRGKGLPDLHGGRGDLYAVLQIIVPPAGDEVRELSRALDGHYEGDVRKGLAL